MNQTNDASPTNPTPPEKKLPPLRKGITFIFNDYDFEGKPIWMVHDSGRNKFFAIGWLEHEILQRWSLGTASAIIKSVNEETTLHIDQEDIDHILYFVTHNYLIDQSGYQIFKLAKDQKLFKKDNYIRWLIDSYLFFRIPLFRPNKFLDKTKKIGDILFSRITLYVMLVLAFIAIYQISMRWDQFTHTFPTIFTLHGLILYLFVYLFCKFFHELGHAYMCKHYGVPVPSLGLAFLVFWPVLYTDTTLSWPLKNNQRMNIALAGIITETYVTIIAALIWCNVHNTTLQAICYLVISVNWMASLLINVSPFMRFDGYYVLADYLKIPNLQPRAFALTRWQIRHWLFHWPDPPPENFNRRMHNFLVIYSIITWVYRLIIYLGIAVLVYHFFIKIVGILLFAIEIYYFVLNPILNEVRSWVYFKEKFSLNIRTKITIFSTVVLLLIFFLPIHETVSFPGTLSYAHEFLIAPNDSILMSALPKPGTKVKANQPIVILKSDDLDQALEEIQLQYQKTLSQLRRASIQQEYESEKSVLLSELNKLQANYKKYFALRSRFTLTVPFDGIVADIDYELRPGTFIMRDQWIADIIQPNRIQVEAFVSDKDVNQIKKSMKGYFYPDNFHDHAIPVKITSIEILNANKLTCQYSTGLKQNKKEDIVIETPCYNASELGGEIAAEMNEAGDFVPVNSVYRVLLSVDSTPKINYVERGKVIINTSAQSFAYSFFYSVKKMWVKQSNL